MGSGFLLLESVSNQLTKEFMRTIFSNEQIAKLKQNPCVFSCGQRSIHYSYEILQSRKKTVDKKQDDTCCIQRSSSNQGRGLEGSKVSTKRGTHHQTVNCDFSDAATHGKPNSTAAFWPMMWKFEPIFCRKLRFSSKF